MAIKSYFALKEIVVLGQAVEVAEEQISNFFCLSDNSWRRYPYEIFTLENLQPCEISSIALAQVFRMRSPPIEGRLRAKDYFRICLQDHNLLHLVQREKKVLLLPLLTYVIAHELVHVIRFYKFQHLFEADENKKIQEEALVHSTTFQVLAKVRMSGLERILNYYKVFITSEKIIRFSYV